MPREPIEAHDEEAINKVVFFLHYVFKNLKFYFVCPTEPIRNLHVQENDVFSEIVSDRTNSKFTRSGK
jgi:hypothetical protein